MWVYSFSNKTHLRSGSVVFTNNMHRVLIETETLIIETIWRILGMIHWTKPGQNFQIDALNLPGNPLKAIYILEGFHQSKTSENVERVLDAIKGNHRREKLKIWKRFGKYPSVFNKLDCSFFTSHVIIFSPKIINNPGLLATWKSELVTYVLWVFPRLKSLLNGRRFQIVVEIKDIATRQLVAILKKDFEESFEKWKFW